jgi:ligand-binding sensor domain-containing protein
LVYRSVSGEWTEYKVGLPDNAIKALESDENGGLWIATFEDLAYRSVSGELTVYTTSLPIYGGATALEHDDSGGLWIGSFGNLVYRSISGEWIDYSSNYSVTALESDVNGGLWMGTSDGLRYRSVSGEWVIYTKNNSALRSQNIHALTSDGSGGLWISTSTELVYRSVNGEWTIYSYSELPFELFDYIRVIESDDSGGVWIKNFLDLAYLNVSGEWAVYTTDNSELLNRVDALASDTNGGLWILSTFVATTLTYRNVKGEETVYTEDNSELPLNSRIIESDGHGGLWIGTYDEGLAYLSISGEWTVYTTDNSELPSNKITVLESDSRGGLWVGTSELWNKEEHKTGGLIYRSVGGEWTVYTTDNSGLLYNDIDFLESDSNGGLWIGSEYHETLTYRSVNGEWTVSSYFDSGQLPFHDFNIESLENDGRGGLWIETSDDGLIYRSVSGEWTIYDQDNSVLPSNKITALKSDGRGGLWIGINEPWNEEELTGGGSGLAYRSVSGEWTVYTTDNSGLPSNWVSALENDDSGGLWIESYDDLAYRSINGQWTNVPYNDRMVTAFESDGNGGLWIGTYDEGLAYRSVSGEWKFYTTDNSGLPSNQITALESDGSGGVWIGSYDGLAYRSVSDEFYTADNSRLPNISVESLLRRSDGLCFDDCIVDAPATSRCRLQSVDNPIPQRPVTVEDVRQAFTWAQTGGKLDYPLYVFFINHGGTDKFQLAKDGYLEVTTFKAILDDYQNATGNQLVLVIDACYSGVLLEKLKAPNRAIISSTGNGLAYFDRGNKQGFSRFFSEGLLYGMSFHEAFRYATDKQNRLVRSLNIGQDQVPQFYDAQQGEWLREIFINGAFTVGDLTLNVEALTTATTLTAGQVLNLQAKVTQAQGTIKRVWAILKPPKVNLIMDSNGTPILAFPSFNLYHTDNEEIWATTWPDAVYNGEHEIVFYAEDNQSNIANSEPVIITVNGGVDSPEQSQVQIVLEKDRYQAGESFKAELIEDLGWGYDLYAAVMFPDGNFLALKKTNDIAPVNQAKQWFGQRSQNKPITLFDLTLPPDLPTGEYCIYGILSPEDEDVFETLAQGLSVVERQCVNILEQD